jgi:hypothetical protein
MSSLSQPRLPGSGGPPISAKHPHALPYDEGRSKLAQRSEMPATSETGGSKERMRLNHMELSVPSGDLTKEFRHDLDSFYGEIFGWTGFDTDVGGQDCHLLMFDGDQFVLVVESQVPMSSPGHDHLGLLQSSRDEVDGLLYECQAHAERDHRVQVIHREDLAYPGLTVHSFYVRYLLPVYFDVHCLEPSLRTRDAG